jgi:TonB family protein
MKKSHFSLFAALLIGGLLRVGFGQVAKESEKTRAIGYVNCSDRDQAKVVPAYLDTCEHVPVAGLACGRSVTVLERRGPWLKVGVEEGDPRYIVATAISQRADKFVPFDVDSKVENLEPANCFANEQERRNPRAIYQVDAEYTKKARQKKISGNVQLRLTVGTDGLPREIQVEKQLGYGLDEAAVAAVGQWKFQPAMVDGKPVEKRIQVTMAFHLY